MIHTVAICDGTVSCRDGVVRRWYRDSVGAPSQGSGIMYVPMVLSISDSLFIFRV